MPSSDLLSREELRRGLSGRAGKEVEGAIMEQLSPASPAARVAQLLREVPHVDNQDPDDPDSPPSTSTPRMAPWPRESAR